MVVFQHALGEADEYPVFEIPISLIFSPDYKKTAKIYFKEDYDSEDKRWVRKYMRQIKSGKYEPIFVCPNSERAELVDGTHRAMAAALLGKDTIMAYVCQRHGKHPWTVKGWNK
jgi:hypothetical protein